MAAAQAPPTASFNPPNTYTYDEDFDMAIEYTDREKAALLVHLLVSLGRVTGLAGFCVSSRPTVAIYDPLSARHSLRVRAAELH